MWIEGDPVRLAQVLSNLLNNAARYTERTGAVTLSTRRDGDQAVVSVTDNGRGFEPAMAENLFDMFSRGDGSAGLGVGLSLARRLVDMHGGTIRGYSAGRGLGAEFTVRLPLAAPARPTQAPHSKEIEVTADSLRILVVDDNVDAAESMQTLLELLGAQVRTANDGRRAIDLFGEFGPDIVLLDIGMPEMDGYEVARALRQLDPQRHTSVVALTGWGQEQDRERTREAGFDKHLVKPVDVDALQELIDSVSAKR
jgi:CheY-like chemotaxis protein